MLSFHSFSLEAEAILYHSRLTWSFTITKHHCTPALMDSASSQVTSICGSALDCLIHHLPLDLKPSQCNKVRSCLNVLSASSLYHLTKLQSWELIRCSFINSLNGDISYLYRSIYEIEQMSIPVIEGFSVTHLEGNFFHLRFFLSDFIFYGFVFSRSSFKIPVPANQDISRQNGNPRICFIHHSVWTLQTIEYLSLK